mmetsp:Transcript_4279/g.13666  ORF Transcript_4279/g.13666 Transcript_4279/m.13666 type:complete len:244 (-) Transcript_4279:290-1021(-)
MVSVLNEVTTWIVKRFSMWRCESTTSPLYASSIGSPGTSLAWLHEGPVYSAAQLQVSSAVDTPCPVQGARVCARYGVLANFATPPVEWDLWLCCPGAMSEWWWCPLPAPASCPCPCFPPLAGPKKLRLTLGVGGNVTMSPAAARCWLMSAASELIPSCSRTVLLTSTSPMRCTTPPATCRSDLVVVTPSMVRPPTVDGVMWRLRPLTATTWMPCTGTPEESRVDGRMWSLRSSSSSCLFLLAL